MKKSEEIPSGCLSTNSSQGGRKGWPPHAQGRGHPAPPGGANAAPSSLPAALPPSPVAQAAPAGPASGRRVPEGGSAPRAGPSLPTSAPHPAPLPGTRPLPPPRRPGLGPAPRVPASPGPEACRAAAAPAPPAPAPTRPGTYPQKPQGQRGGRLGALLRSLPASPMVLGGGGARRRQWWRRLGLGPARRRRRRRRRGARGGGRGRERARGRARVRGSEPGFQAGQLEAGRTTRPEETGGPGEARRGEGGELRRRGVRVNRGPRGRREDPAPSAAPTAAPARVMSRAAVLGRTCGPRRLWRSSGRCEARGPARSVTPSAPPEAALTGQWPLRPLPAHAPLPRSHNGLARGSRRQSPAADQLGSGRATLFSASKAECGAVGKAERVGLSLGDAPLRLSYSWNF